MFEFKLNRYEVDLEKTTHYNADLQVTTLSELIRNSAHRYADRPLFGEKKNGKYEWMTYAAFYERVLKMRSLLKKSGLSHGDRLAIIANNSVTFAEAVYAAYGLGAVVVPMYEVQSIDDWRYIFNDAQPKVALVKTDEIRVKIEQLECESLKEVLVISPNVGNSIEMRVEAEAAMDENEDAAHPEDLCDIIYTSGTTGRPHGVELTHHNVVHDVIISASMFDYGCHDRVLSFLPWAHGFGKTVDLTMFVAIGSAVGLAESARTVAKNLTEVNPTVLCAVPKIFNRIYDGVNLMLENSLPKRILFGRAQKIMHKARTQKLNRVEQIEYKLMDRLVGAKVRGVFGDSLKFCVSGGASLSREVATFFEDFGIRVFEGYGMTEHAPVISINYNPDKIGSVGVPLPSVKVEIEPLDNCEGGDERIGEIVISSDCVMRGYHNDVGGTAGVIDERGRLHSGDTGYIDDEGFIYITGRVKEQYKLSNGKYVVPSAIEAQINASPDIDFCMVFGSGKPFNVLLVHPSESCMNKFKEKYDCTDASIKSLEERPELRRILADALDKTYSGLRGYEKPQAFAIILEEFTIESGLLTPALKLKRKAVEARYKNILDAMYS